jgi:hypothetical protein
MRGQLKLHSQSRCSAGVRITVEFTRQGALDLMLSYTVTGNVGSLCIPPVTAAVRGDELWRHTCFEAFVRGAGAEYYEFNFAPTTQWAAYRFTGYRSGRCPAEISAPAIDVQSDADRFSLNALLQLDSLNSLPAQASWHLGLSAVIEERNGRISYWAFVHPSEKPDFHQAGSFAYELFPPVQT